MVCIQDFNQWNYLKIEAEQDVIHNGCFSAVPVSFAGFYLHHADMRFFFRVMEENGSRQGTGRQEPAAGIKPGLQGFSEVLRAHGLEWAGEEYDPLTFLRTFNREAFVLCGFYFKNKNTGHAIALFADPQADSKSIYLFDPNHGLFRGDPGNSYDEQLEHYLLSKYPEIDPRRVSFRNVKVVRSSGFD